MRKYMVKRYFKIPQKLRSLVHFFLNVWFTGFAFATLSFVEWNRAFPVFTHKNCPLEVRPSTCLSHLLQNKEQKSAATWQRGWIRGFPVEQWLFCPKPLPNEVSKPFFYHKHHSLKGMQFGAKCWDYWPLKESWNVRGLEAIYGQSRTITVAWGTCQHPKVPWTLTIFFLTSMAASCTFIAI